MSRSKLRDQLYGVQPKHTHLKQEELPPKPAKKPFPGYCKKRKGEHDFELHEVKVSPTYSYPYGYKAGLYVEGWVDRKEYRCTACQKKKQVRESFTLEKPVLANTFIVPKWSS